MSQRYPDWSYLHVLHCVADLLGPFNCLNNVCKNWNKCKKIYTSIITNNKNKFNKLVVNYKHILYLEINDINIIDLKIFGKCVSLRKFICDKTNSNNSELLNIVSRLEHLEDLELDFGFSDSTNERIVYEGIQILGNLQKLRKLTLWAYDCDEYGWCDNILYNLEELRFKCCELNISCMRTVSKLDNVRKLTMWYCDVTDEWIYILSEMKSLISLNIGNSFVTDVGLKYLIEKMGNNLEELNIKGNNINNSLNMLCELKNLHSLDLSGIKGATDDVIRGVCSLKKLHTLHINHCENITDKSVKYLKNSCIPTLSIRGCELTERGIYELRACIGFKEIITYSYTN